MKIPLKHFIYGRTTLAAKLALVILLEKIYAIAVRK
jgi:hypothetical protein